MGLFDKNNRIGGFMDEIRCDEPSYLIWKWHPSGVQDGESVRENSIRWGSSLRVKDGEVAVFVYKQKDGAMQDYIVGPYDETIKTANFPVLASIVGLAYEGGTPFQAEIYFINIARIIQVKFAVPFFEVYDPRFADFGVPVAIRGTISFKIDDYKEFIKLHRLSTFDLEDFQRQIRDAVSRYVKDAVANAPSVHNIPVIQIESKTAFINDMVELDIKDRMKENFGVVVSGVDIGAIEIDKGSAEYAKLMAITQKVTTETVQAQTEANIKNIHDMQRIEAENYEEMLRVQREESQYAQHMATQSTNFAAFQVEKQAEVGVAGAHALGQMGANGAGNINFGDGGNGSGFNPAAMMASMAVGGVVGQNVAGMLNGMMAGVNQPNNGMVPPPVPTVAYHVVINGQATGPFNMDTLKQMALNGQLNRETLVWKNGMDDWAKVDTVQELDGVFVDVPPVPPVE